MSDYCLFQNQCGLGMDCSACMGTELARRAECIADLERQLSEAKAETIRVARNALAEHERLSAELAELKRQG